MKRFDSDDQDQIETEAMDDEDQKVFDTPLLNYLKKRENFIKQFRHQVWGKYGTKDRVIAMNKLLRYMNETIEYAEKNPDGLKIDHVLHDTKNLVCDKNVLPSMPWNMRRELILANVDTDDATHRELVDKILEKVEEMKSSSFKLFVNDEIVRSSNLKFSEDENDNFAQQNVKKSPDVREDKNIGQLVQEEMNEESFQLRYLRKQIYNKIDLKQDVTFDIQKYRVKAEEFLLKFKNQLNVNEVKIWKGKISKTEGDVKKYENVLKGSEDKLKDSYSDDIVIHGREDVVLFKDIHKIEAAKKLFESMNREENFAKTLPKVPAEENATDKEIEERLLKLKFFRRAWITDEASTCETPQTEPKVKIAVKADIHSETKIIVTSDDKTPDVKTKNESKVKPAPDVISHDVAKNKVYSSSTPEETKSCNDWFEEELELKRPKKKKKSSSQSNSDVSDFPPAQEESLYDKFVLSDAKSDEKFHTCACSTENNFHQLHQEPILVNLQYLLVVMIAINQLMIGQIRKVFEFQFSRSPSVLSPPSVSFLPSKAVPVPVMSPLPMETTALMTRTREEILGLAKEWGFRLLANELIA